MNHVAPLSPTSHFRQYKVKFLDHGTKKKPTTVRQVWKWILKFYLSIHLRAITDHMCITLTIKVFGIIISILVIRLLCLKSRASGGSKVSGTNDLNFKWTVIVIWVVALHELILRLSYLSILPYVYATTVSRLFVNIA